MVMVEALLLLPHHLSSVRRQRLKELKKRELVHHSLWTSEVSNLSITERVSLRSHFYLSFSSLEAYRQARKELTLSNFASLQGASLAKRLSKLSAKHALSLTVERS